MWSLKHQRGWEGAALEFDAGCSIQRRCPRITAASEFIIFFFSLIRTDSARFALNQTDSAWIRLHRLNWVVLAGDQNRPKSALNHARTTEIGFEWGPNILNLSFLDFILNIWCFFCVFFFVLCFSPSSFFVLWIKTTVMWFLKIF